MPFASLERPRSLRFSGSVESSDGPYRLALRLFAARAGGFGPAGQGPGDLGFVQRLLAHVPDESGQAAEPHLAVSADSVASLALTRTPA